MYKKKPFFIVFEGIEGCGKSYQGKKLYNRFKKKQINSLIYLISTEWALLFAGVIAGTIAFLFGGKKNGK